MKKDENISVYTGLSAILFPMEFLFPFFSTTVYFGTIKEVEITLDL